MLPKPLGKKIQSRKLGLLIRDARQVSARTPEHCALYLGVPTQTYEAYELGQEAISLPRLEALANYLDVPIEHFWGTKVLSSGRPAQRDIPKWVEERQAQLARLLRSLREKAGLSCEELALQAGVQVEDYQAWENAQQEIPIPALETLCKLLNCQIQDFFDKESFADRRGYLHLAKEFLDLPPDLQEFILKPENHPFLKAAMLLSQVDRKLFRELGDEPHHD